MRNGPLSRVRWRPTATCLRPGRTVGKKNPDGARPRGAVTFVPQWVVVGHFVPSRVLVFALSSQKSHDRAAVA